jgi:hypothetical protein
VGLVDGPHPASSDALDDVVFPDSLDHRQAAGGRPGDDGAGPGLLGRPRRRRRGGGQWSASVIRVLVPDARSGHSVTRPRRVSTIRGRGRCGSSAGGPRAARPGVAVALDFDRRAAQDCRAVPGPLAVAGSGAGRGRPPHPGGLSSLSACWRQGGRHHAWR